MVSASESLPSHALPPLPAGQRLRAWIYRNEAVRGYLLLSPTLLVMVGLMIVPLIGMIALSFFSQTYVSIDYTFTLNNYWTIFEPSDKAAYFLGIPFYLKKPIYLLLLFKSILISLASTIAVVALAYPMAYFLAFRVTKHKMVWLILITVPFWTSYLLRVFAWKIILGYGGVINSALLSLHLISQPLGALLYNPFAVVVTLTHAWAAFAILPIYVSLEKIDRSLLEAATDLGDGPIRRFLRITLPLSMPGVIGATILIFVPTTGDYVTPTLVGGPQGAMIANVIAVQFERVGNWPLGAALALASMAMVALAAGLFVAAARLVTRTVK
jgi:spermidine/putrescine transport system permease protein